MGSNIFDQYSLLHFCSGYIIYFSNISLLNWILIHILFEIIENSSLGMNFIKGLKWWPGGKHSRDSIINIVSDTIFAILGWIIAYKLEKMSL